MPPYKFEIFVNGQLDYTCCSRNQLNMYTCILDFQGIDYEVVITNLADQDQFIIFRYKENKDMTNETAKLEIIKNVLTRILESDVIVDDNKSDAFKFGYLKGTINTIIGYINEEMVTTTQHEIQEVEYIVRWRDMCSHTGSSPVLTTKSGGVLET